LPFSFADVFIDNLCVLMSMSMTILPPV
jgi:hypothetical protein